MKWKQRSGIDLDPALSKKYQLSPLSAKLFSLRGINTEEKLGFWFNATEDDLADPFLMHDMDKTVERINQAIDNGEKITIYGDYDADGITATSIMVETLSILGADVHYFIPNRFKDGYGPNLSRYQEIVADGTNLIITVDNGVTGVEEVKYAQSNNVDVILTDHHTFQEDIPKPYALVHCNYPNQKYPFDDYCGAGVAYTICRALMQDTMPELLDLAMIGTIGDMVKVSSEGHVVVKRGLEILNQTERPGLRALIKNAKLNLGSINETDVGFNIAPRLNAVGRLGDANLAVQLLLSDNEIQAQELADKVEELNNERKELTNQIFQSCLDQVKENGWQKNNTLVIYNSDFHEGILGLVANKVTEKLHKPTIVLTKSEKGEVKGSGRSFEGFNLFNALSPLKNGLLSKFGGHDFACGLSLREENISKLRSSFEKSFSLDQIEQIHYYDEELDLAKIDTDTIAQIQQAGPFGTDNIKPIFAISQPTITKFYKIGKDKNHVKFVAQKNGGQLDIVGFNIDYLNNDLLPFIDKIFIDLNLNSFGSKESLQGIITDISYAAPKLAVPAPVIDMRTESFVMGFADRYLLFDKKNIDFALSNYGIDPEKLTLISDYNKDGEVVVLLDTPHNQVELNLALEKNYQQLYLRFLLDTLPVDQIPSKDEFSKVLKYIYSHPGLSPEDYQDVAPFLNIEYDSVLFILRVFFELGFIQLEDQKLHPVKDPEKKPLSDSKYLSTVKNQLDFVRQLRTMPSNLLLSYIKKFNK